MSTELKPYEWLQLNTPLFLSHCERQSFIASAPGGQHMQKTQTGIRLHFKPLDVKAECQNSRQQNDNLTHAIRTLKLRIALMQTEPLPEKDVVNLKPFFKNGVLINPKNDLYPLVVACVIGTFYQHAAELKSSSVRLNISIKKLTSFLSSNKEMFQKAQTLRQAFNKSPLRSL